MRYEISAIQRQLGYRQSSFITSRTGEKVGIREVSLNLPASEEGGADLQELLEDESSTRFVEEFELSDIELIVRAELDKLPGHLQQIIRLHYYDGLTMPYISRLLGEPLKEVKKRRLEGMRLLRQSEALRYLHDDLTFHARTAHLYGLEWFPGYYETKRSVEAIQRSGKYISYGTMQMLVHQARLAYRAKRAGHKTV